MSEYVLCKKCNVEITPNYRPRPDTPHDGELRCPLCGIFLGWQRKQKNDGKRERNKWTPARLGIDFCQLCMRPKDRLGINEVLLPHHIVEIQDGGEDVPENIWIVCTACHSVIHHQRTYLNNHMAVVWQKYEEVKKVVQDVGLTNGDYDAIISKITDILGV